MSELKLTISQLENLLDRQKESILDYIKMNLHPHSMTSTSIGTQAKLFSQGQVEHAIRKANYPHDFSILKRYVK